MISFFFFGGGGGGELECDPLCFFLKVCKRFLGLIKKDHLGNCISQIVYALFRRRQR